MTLDQINKMHYPAQSEINAMALRNFIRWHITDTSKTEAITLTLLRGNIRSIKDLAECSVDDLRKIRGIGPAKMAELTRLKELLRINVTE